MPFVVCGRNFERDYQILYTWYQVCRRSRLCALVPAIVYAPARFTAVPGTCAQTAWWATYMQIDAKRTPQPGYGTD